MFNDTDLTPDETMPDDATTTVDPDMDDDDADGDMTTGEAADDGADGI